MEAGLVGVGQDWEEASSSEKLPQKKEVGLAAPKGLQGIWFFLEQASF